MQRSFFLGWWWFVVVGVSWSSSWSLRRFVTVVHSFSLPEEGRRRRRQRHSSLQRHQQRLSRPATAAQDSDDERASIQSWRATSATASSAKIVYSAPSSLDPTATVQVKERVPSGWHTLGIVGGRTKSIYHGVFQVVVVEDDTVDNEHNDNHHDNQKKKTSVIDPCALGPSDYLRTMAAIVVTTTAAAEEATTKKLQFLHLGFGSGSLMRYVSHILPESQHVAVEIDASVVDAAFTCGLVIPPTQQLTQGDGLTYVPPPQPPSSSQQPLEYVCIDVFDGDNIMPPEFYSMDFLQHVYTTLLSSKEGIVLHNFHTGSDKLTRQLEDAKHMYTQVFSEGTVLTVESFRSNGSSGGNTILVASKSSHQLLPREGRDEGEQGTTTTPRRPGEEPHDNLQTYWKSLAILAQTQWNIRFDVPFRVQSVQRVSGKENHSLPSPPPTTTIE